MIISPALPSPPELAGQATCPDAMRTVFGFGSEAVVDARSAVLMEDGIVLFGKQAAVARHENGALRADSMIAGLRMIVASGGEARVVPVPLPQPGLRVRAAKAIGIGPREARVFFRGVAPDESEESESYTLWTARLIDGEWRGLIRVGEFQDPRTIRTEITDAVVSVRGRQAFAFLQSADGRRPTLVTVWVTGDSVTVDRQDLPLVGIGYTTLAEHAGDLYIAMTAESAVPRHRDTKFRPLGLWLGRLGEFGWSEFRPVTQDDSSAVFEPKLLSTPSGLLLAYNVEVDARRISFRWRSVSDSSLAEHRLDGLWPVSRPSGTFGDLVALPDTSKRARILRLSALGYQVVATVQNLAFVPVLAGWGERLFASSWVKEPGKAWPEVGIYDLSCGV
jgi:hypothetical protein